MALDPILKFKNLKSFKRDLWGDEFAHCVSRITIGWGNIEYRLFWLLHAIDIKNAPKWAALLFASRMLARRKKIVRDEIATAVQISYPKFIGYVDTQFSNLQSIQDRRNLLAHGLWLDGLSDESFEIQPLSLKTGTPTLEEAVEVDHSYLSKLIEDMERFEHELGWLTAEMMAHQQLKKWGKR